MKNDMKVWTMVKTSLYSFWNSNFIFKAHYDSFIQRGVNWQHCNRLWALSVTLELSNFQMHMQADFQFELPILSFIVAFSGFFYRKGGELATFQPFRALPITLEPPNIQTFFVTNECTGQFSVWNYNFTPHYGIFVPKRGIWKHCSRFGALPVF